MRPLKVLTLVGTRPEIIRLSQVLRLLDRTSAIEHVLVHTGQNYDYELNEVFFEDLGLRKPDHFLNAAGRSPMDTVGKILSSLDDLLTKSSPDAFLVLGDTNSCLGALAAKRHRIPIFHMEAGNRCFDQRVPEETNRRIVDSISDINLTYSTIARDYLIKEGAPADRVIKTGSPMREVLAAQKEKIQNSDVLGSLALNEREYFLVSAHREENIETSNFERLVRVLNGLCERFDLPVIMSTHPRTRKRIEQTGAKFSPLVRLMKPMGFNDYNALQIGAKAVLSDSGTISEESSILNFPALNIREAHERPEAMEEASVIMTGLNLDRVLQALEVITSQQRGEQRTLAMVEDYSSSNVSEKVLRVILSYTDYVRRTVWKEA